MHTPDASTPASDETLEALIEESGGYWKEDVFCIAGGDLMQLLRFASKAGGQIAKSAAAQDAPTPVPNGWKLVPVRPTNFMISRGMGADSTAINAIGAMNCWAAMVGAAPAPHGARVASGYRCADCKSPLRPGWTCDACGSSAAEDA